jgi:hypothetical protein
VIALVAAGGLAAALSTAAGLLLAISSAISHDLLKGMCSCRTSRRKAELNASRVSMIGAIGAPATWAQSTGLRGRDGGPGLRPRRLVDLPGADDGHLQQAR